MTAAAAVLADANVSDTTVSEHAFAKPLRVMLLFRLHQADTVHLWELLQMTISAMASA